MNSYYKNKTNAFALLELNIGDKVRVIATGETGVITKKVKYNRGHQNYYSPYGYSTVQVRFDNYDNLPQHRKIGHYAASSLQKR